MARIEERGGSVRIIVEAGRDPVTKKRQIYRKTIDPDVLDGLTPAKRTKRINELATMFEAEIRKGTYIDPETVTFAAYARQWLLLRKPEIADHTHYTYESCIENYLVPYFGEHFLLSQIKVIHVDQFKAKMLTDGKLKTSGGLASETVRLYLRCLRAILSSAVEHELIGKNPALKVKLPVVSKAERQAKITILTADQMQLFLHHAKMHTDYDIWYLMMFTGLREGEALGLRWHDVNLDKKYAMIAQQCTTEGNSSGMVIKEVKTDSSKAKIDLTDSIVDIFKRRKSMQAKYRIQFGADYEDNDLIFCKKNGSPIYPTAFYNRFKRFVRRIGLNMHPHDLRHNLASLLLAGGYNIKIVQEALRHARSSTTLDIYSHLMPKVRQEALQTIEDNILIDLQKPTQNPPIKRVK